MSKFSSAYELRQAIRQGSFQGHTSGAAGPHVQGNLVVLPKDWASEFLLFCQRNPKPCPLLAVGDPGDPLLPSLGRDLDVRTDLPKYRVWKNGEIVSELNDVRDLWRDDLVAFVIGCSFSFEQALLDAGIGLRHVAQGRNVAMYRSSLQTVAAGRFHGPMVVSMRPMKASEAILAVQVTSRFPANHGAPVHLGHPGQIGIADLSQPDYGDSVQVLADEVPVFWACGVTPQAALRQARPEFCITHSPGCMLVTDKLNHQMASA
jgi:uncharacterized protein YcsI (UPF0317 family)